MSIIMPKEEKKSVFIYLSQRVGLVFPSWSGIGPRRCVGCWAVRVAS